MLTPGLLIQNRYRIIGRIGQGGMGAVYKAMDERLHNDVAMKQMLVNGEKPRKAFAREARLLARLHHVSLPRVIDHFTDNHGQFLVMDFIPGPDLAELLQQHGTPFPLNGVMRLAIQLLDVLEYLHSHRPPIIHRDIKPQNIKINLRRQVMLLDFGLAKGFEVNESQITQGSSISGYTPRYAPLEQIEGTGTDERSDLYALGATLYTLLTGIVPVGAMTRAAILINQQPDPQRPAHLVNPHVPFPISDLLMQVMALRADERPSSALAMRSALHEAYKQCKAMTAPHTSTTLAQATSSLTQIVTSSPAGTSPPATSTIQSIHNLAMDQSATTASKTFSSPTCIKTLKWHMAKVNSVAFSPDGKALASASDDTTVQIWWLSRGTGSLPNTLRGHQWKVNSVAFSPNSQIVASASDDMTVRLWRVDDGTPIHTLKGHMRKVNSVAFAPNGESVASTSHDTTVKLWRVSDGTLLYTFKDHMSWVYHMAFSPDGNIFASASNDSIVRVWRLSDGMLIRALRGHMSWVYCVAFSPDNQFLASASSDDTIRIWSVKDGSIVQVLTGHSSWVYSVAFSPDNQFLASASWDDTVRIWNVHDGTSLHTLKGHISKVTSVAFAPDGKTLASGSQDETVRLWRVQE